MLIRRFYLKKTVALRLSPNINYSAVLHPNSTSNMRESSYQRCDQNNALTMQRKRVGWTNNLPVEFCNWRNAAAVDTTQLLLQNEWRRKTIWTLQPNTLPLCLHSKTKSRPSPFFCLKNNTSTVNFSPQLSPPTASLQENLGPQLAETTAINTSQTNVPLTEATRDRAEFQ